MAEGEPRPDGDGPLARRDEAPCHEVDGGDVVGVEGVAEPERVGEGGGGEEGPCVEGEDDGHEGPDREVEERDEGDDAEGAEGDCGEDGEADVLAGDAVEEPGFEGGGWRGGW